MSSEVDIRKSEANPAEHNTGTLTLRAHTHLKKAEYLLAMFALGLDTNPKRARLIHMADKTVASALEGKPISGEFIGNLLTALSEHPAKLKRFDLVPDFDTFFVIRKEVNDAELPG